METPKSRTLANNVYADEMHISSGCALFAEDKNSNQEL